MSRLLLGFFILIVLFISACNKSDFNELDDSNNARDLSNSDELIESDTTTSPLPTVEEENDFSTESVLVLSNVDFTFHYHNIVIDDTIPFLEIADNLGIIIDQSEDDNVDFRAGGWFGEDQRQHFSWYIVHYPSRHNPDLVIEYVYSDTLDEAWIVRVSLYQIPTHRGIQAGDDYQKLIELYGEKNITDAYSVDGVSGYYLEHYDVENSASKHILVNIDETTKVIQYIEIDYCFNETMQLLDIAGFGP